MRFFIALLAGAASVFAYAPFGLFPLMFLSLAVLALLLRRTASARAGFLLGFAWGFGAFVAGIGWLYIALNRYGGLPMPLSALAIALFSTYLALYPALAGALTVRFRPAGAFAQALLFAAFWLLSEWLRGVLFTGFPWLAVGYTQTPPLPLAGFAPIVGVYGIGAIVAFISALAVWTPWRQRAKAVAAAAAILVLPVGGFALSHIAWTTPQGEPLPVALLQTNIAQDLKWDSARLYDWLQVTETMVRENPAKLIVLPETTLPLVLDDLPENYLPTLAAHARKAGGDLVIGAFISENARIYNGAITQGMAPSQQYHKQHLVPFGEYSPPLFGWFFRLLNLPMSNQHRGSPDQPPLKLGGQRIAVNICYEDLFGAELLHALPEATLMLNLSNLAWYGHSHAQPQHLQIARMRVLETGRPMLRATNTGMTAIIQPNGQVTAVLPQFERLALHAQVQGFTGSTPYAGWGDLPVLIAALLMGVGGVVRKLVSSDAREIKTGRVGRG